MLIAFAPSVINPTNGKVITRVSEGTPKDVDRAVEIAQKAFDTVWGTNCPGFERGRLLYKLAELLEAHQDEVAAVEALDNGKTFLWAKGADLALSIDTLRHYAGWADKNMGQVIEVSFEPSKNKLHPRLGADK